MKSTTHFKCDSDTGTNRNELVILKSKAYQLLKIDLIFSLKLKLLRNHVEKILTTTVISNKKVFICSFHLGEEGNGQIIA